MSGPGWLDMVRLTNEPPRFQILVADGTTGGCGFSPDPPKWQPRHPELSWHEKRATWISEVV
jgi:hypothetical protein